MAGYWPSFFLACLWTETKSRSINTQKKERNQYLAIFTDRGNFSCGTRRVVPSGQDSSILPIVKGNETFRE